MTPTTPTQTLFPELEQNLTQVLPEFIGCDLPELLSELSSRIAAALREEYAQGKAARPTTIVKIPKCEWTPATVIKMGQEVNDQDFLEKTQDVTTYIPLDTAKRERFLRVLAETLACYYRKGLLDGHDVILDREITPNYTPTGIMR